MSVKTTLLVYLSRSALSTTFLKLEYLFNADLGAINVSHLTCFVTTTSILPAFTLLRQHYFRLFSEIRGSPNTANLELARMNIHHAKTRTSMHKISLMLIKSAILRSRFLIKLLQVFIYPTLQVVGDRRKTSMHFSCGPIMFPPSIGRHLRCRHQRAQRKADLTRKLIDV